MSGEGTYVAENSAYAGDDASVADDESVFSGRGVVKCGA